MLIRPVHHDDLPQLLKLAHKAGVGMLSLPADEAALQKKITTSIASFSGTYERPNEEAFLFAMEDTDTGELVGTTGIFAHVGLSRPFYSYKLSTLVQANSEQGIYARHHVLHMVNDYTNVTEIGALFLLPEYRRDGLGSLLSRCRYLLIAEFPHLFDDTVIAEIRGVNDDAGGAPFYDALAAHFFQMTYAEAEHISATQGNQFIADLMPRYPIYVNLLPKAAQDVIGKPLKASEAAMKLLMREGFSWEDYVDVFDAGPTLQADRANIRAIQRSVKLKVCEIIESVSDGDSYMICNARMPEFHICLDRLEVAPEGVIISRATARKLNVEIGDAIRFTPA